MASLYCIVGAPPLGTRLWLTNTFITHASDIIEGAGFIVDVKALREPSNGTLHRYTTLEPDTMHGMSGSSNFKESPQWFW